MTTLIKILAAVLAFLRFFVPESEGARWNKELKRLQEDFNAKQQAYLDAVARGDSAAEPVHYQQWMYAAEALRRHRDSKP